MNTLPTGYTVTQHRYVNGHTVKHIHTPCYDAVLLNGVLIFLDSNVPTVAMMYDAVCRGLREAGRTPTDGMLTHDQIAEMG